MTEPLRARVACGMRLAAPFDHRSGSFTGTLHQRLHP